MQLDNMNRTNTTNKSRMNSSAPEGWAYLLNSKKIHTTFTNKDICRLAGSTDIVFEWSNIIYLLYGTLVVDSRHTYTVDVNPTTHNWR